MDKTIVEAQMVHHLKNIQKLTQSVLVQFKESGVTIDGDFIKYFLKLSIESMTQTCDKLEREWCIVTRNKQKAIGVGTFDGDVSNGVNACKRKSETIIMNNGQAKGPTLTPLSSAAILPTQQNDVVFYCDYCIASNDLNNLFSGTADEVREHCLSAHLNGSISQPIENSAIEEHSKNTIFYCDYCINSKDPNKVFCGSFDEVYDHWLSSHLNDSISQPFQFHAVGRLRCYHCGKLDSFQKLVKHHKTRHTNKMFAVSDQENMKKCGICRFKDGNLIEHFKCTHEAEFSSKVFNPVLYLEERIIELLNINAENEFHCIECNETFPTHAETYCHFAILHAGIDANPFIGGQNNPAYLICGFCAKIVDVNQYLNHFKKHSYNFPCTTCSYRSSDLAELVFHQRTVHNSDTLDHHCSVFPDWLRNKNLNTKLVFNNGLVLKNCNVLGTKFDDSKLFNIFVDGILDAKKERLEQMMKMNTSPN